MNDIDKIKDGLKDYLRGLSRGRSEDLQFIIANPIWQSAAYDELNRRNIKLLESLSNEDLESLACGDVNLVKLAKEVHDEAPK